MKTEAIKKCINTARKTGWLDDGYEDITKTAEAELAAIESEITGLRGEIGFLEEQIAVKDDAIISGVANTKMLAQYYPGLYREEATAWEDIEAALTTADSGKVLVEREKLQEIRHVQDIEEYACAFCPVCGSRPDRNETCTADCWLSALNS